MHKNGAEQVRGRRGMIEGSNETQSKGKEGVGQLWSNNVKLAKGRSSLMRSYNGAQSYNIIS